MAIPDPNSTAVLITEPFGTGAANPTYIKLPIPVASQTGITVNAASFTDGFPPSTMTPESSGGLPFFGQDMNGILYMISANVACVMSGFLPTFSAARATALGGYNEGAIVQNANATGFWISVAPNNSANPDTVGTNWMPLAAANYTPIACAGTDITLTPLQAAAPFIELFGTLTANINVIMPLNWQGKSWVIDNVTSGAFTITVKTATGAGVIVPPTGPSAPTSVYTDGGAIYNTGISTAGLAPINSPTLTGVPTTPSAAAATSTTQIASTAMVQAAIVLALATYAPKASPILTGTPTAPTAPANTNNTQLATTQYVDRAVSNAAVQRKSGTFTCINGDQTVPFGVAFASPPRVFVQWNYAGPNVGWVVPGSITTTGFTYHNSNSGICDWFATLD